MSIDRLKYFAIIGLENSRLMSCLLMVCLKVPNDSDFPLSIQGLVAHDKHPFLQKTAATEVAQYLRQALHSA